MYSGHDRGHDQACTGQCRHVGDTLQACDEGTSVCRGIAGMCGGIANMQAVHL